MGIFLKGARPMFQILLILLCVAGFFLAFRIFELRSIFFPSNEMVVTPADFGLKFEDVFFETADHKKLNGWFIPAEGGKETVLFCHGNAGNIGYRMEKLIFFQRMGYDTFIFDYRGYGKSKGWPDEQGLYRDTLAAYDYLRSRGIAAERIIGYGESIGGACVVALAFKQPIKAMILENTFTSVKDMVKIYMPFIPFWVLSSRFDSKQKIALITIPKLIVQSENDEIVPPDHGKTLFEVAAPPKEFLAIRGTHNEAFFESEKLLEDKIRIFLATL